MLDPSAIRESHCPRNLDSLSHYLAGVAMRIALSTPDRLKDASIGTSDGVLTYTPLFESAPDDDSRVSFNNAASLFAGIYAEARFNTPGMLPPDDNDQLEVLINSDYPPPITPFVCLPFTSSCPATIISPVFTEDLISLRDLRPRIEIWRAQRIANANVRHFWCDLVELAAHIKKTGFVCRQRFMAWAAGDK